MFGGFYAVTYTKWVAGNKREKNQLSSVQKVKSRVSQTFIYIRCFAYWCINELGKKLNKKKNVYWKKKLNEVQKKEIKLQVNGKLDEVQCWKIERKEFLWRKLYLLACHKGFYV